MAPSVHTHGRVEAKSTVEGNNLNYSSDRAVTGSASKAMRMLDTHGFAEQRICELRYQSVAIMEAFLGADMNFAAQSMRPELAHVD
jgi:hypothetical protein